MSNKFETISNLFEGKEIRSIWDGEKGDYYFSVVDVIGAVKLQLTNYNALFLKTLYSNSYIFSRKHGNFL